MATTFHVEPIAEATAMIEMAQSKKRKGENSRSKESEESKKRKFPIKENGGKQKEREFSIKDQKKKEEICRKVLRPDNI